MRDYKAARGCRDCGEHDPIVLAFHHRDPATKNPRLRKTGITFRLLSWEDLAAEMEKCDVLCANCHLREHAS